MHLRTRVLNRCKSMRKATDTDFHDFTAVHVERERERERKSRLLEKKRQNLLPKFAKEEFRGWVISRNLLRRSNFPTCAGCPTFFYVLSVKGGNFCVMETIIYDFFSLSSTHMYVVKSFSLSPL